MAEKADDPVLQDEKDVPMEDLEEKSAEEHSSQDEGAEKHDSIECEDQEANENATEEENRKKEEEKSEEGERKKEEEERKKREEEDAASDAEIEAEDERATFPPAGNVNWQWHIEIYPIATEDMLLDNFSKVCSTASYSQMVFRESKLDVKKGEAHFYAEDVQTAKNIVRTLCCKRFTYQRPYIYIYRRKAENSEEFETAVLRLDLQEMTKVRWDRQKRAKGEPATRIAKVSNVPLSTSKDLVSVVFARAYRVKMDTVMSAADSKKANAAKAAKEKAKAKRKAEAKAVAAAAKENEDSEEANADDAEEEDEEDDSESEDDDEEVFGKFSGELTVDCCTRASLKGFVLGYRKVAIGGNLLDIKPLSTEQINVQELRKEARKRRWDEAVNGPTWIPVPPKIRFTREEWGPPEYWEQDGVRQGGGLHGRGRGGYGDESSYGARGRGSERGAGGRAGGRGGGDRGGRGRSGMLRPGRERMEDTLPRRGGGHERARPEYGRERRGYEYDRYGHDLDDYARYRGGYDRYRDPVPAYEPEPDLDVLHSIVERNAIELERQIATLHALRDYRDHDRYGDYGDPAYRGGYRDDYYDHRHSGGGRERRRGQAGYRGRRH